MIDVIIITPEITKGMKSIGPKCLLTLRKNMSIIQYQISQIQKNHRQCKLTLSIGFEAEKIKQQLKKYKNISYLLNQEYEDTNQACNVIQYINQNNPKNLLIYSSGIITKNLPIPKKYNKNQSVLFMLNKPKNNFNIGSINSSKIEYLFFDMEECWSEIVFLNHDAIDILKKEPIEKFKQMYLFEIINYLLSKKIPFSKEYINKNDIMKINNNKDIAKARTFI